METTLATRHYDYRPHSALVTTKEEKTWVSTSRDGIGTGCSQLLWPLVIVEGAMGPVTPSDEEGEKVGPGGEKIIENRGRREWGKQEIVIAMMMMSVKAMLSRIMSALPNANSIIHVFSPYPLLFACEIRRAVIYHLWLPLLEASQFSVDVERLAKT